MSRFIRNRSYSKRAQSLTAFKSKPEPVVKPEVKTELKPEVKPEVKKEVPEFENKVPEEKSKKDKKDKKKKKSKSEKVQGSTNKSNR